MSVKPIGIIKNGDVDFHDLAYEIAQEVFPVDKVDEIIKAKLIESLDDATALLDCGRIKVSIHGDWLSFDIVQLAEGYIPDTGLEEHERELLVSALRKAADIVESKHRELA